ncbi:MAG TPA: hypothetical protein VKY27_08065 [Bacteriovoracaceae bacterium]|nr:hypothetical protein [Bacteriovoracaceae bacterium]
MNLKKLSNYFRNGSFCFYCNVDSEELKVFLIIVIGGLFFASVCVALGALFKGYFKNIESIDIKGKVLEIEGDDNGR